MMSKPKNTTFFLKITVKGFPSRWEMNSLKIKTTNIIKRLLLNILSMEIIIECQSCGFKTTCNPNSHNKVRWYCRSCGHVILYEDAVTK
jgi:ribosomal protein S27E